MSRRILLADDSVTIQKVIELTFMDDDYEVRAVGNGDEALAMLTALTVDFVIADVHMPGASGYEVCRRSKQLRPEVPVLLLVGTFEPFDEAQARECGANSYLKKPFDSQELLGRVHELLEAASTGGAPATAAGGPHPEPGAAAAAHAAPAAPAVAEPPAVPGPAAAPAPPPPVAAAAAAATGPSEGTEAPTAAGAAAAAPSGLAPGETAPAGPAAGAAAPEAAPQGAAAPAAAGATPAAGAAPAAGEPGSGEPAAAAPIAAAPDTAAPAAAAPGGAAAAPGAGQGIRMTGGIEAAATWQEFELEAEAEFIPDPWPEHLRPEPSPAATMVPASPPHFEQPFALGDLEEEGAAGAAGEASFPELLDDRAFLLEAEEEEPAAPPAAAPELRATQAEPVSPFGASHSAAPEALAAAAAASLGGFGAFEAAEVRADEHAGHPALAQPEESGKPAAAGNGQPAAAAPAAAAALADQDVDRIARRVVELIGDRVVRDIAWEVIPDLAEVVIKDRLRELESQLE